jgi:DNA-directed RNA polymerase subunit RPC12/RpoP
VAEEYEQGTYLYEFTEAAHEKQNPDASEMAASTAVGGIGVFLALIAGVLGLFFALALFPLGLCIGIPLLALAIYLVAGTGAVVHDTVKARTYLKGECPYCSYTRKPEPLTGDKVRCKHCLNIILVRGTRFYVTESRLKKYRKKIPVSANDV